MNTKQRLIWVIVLLFINSVAISQNVDENYEIGTWHGYRNAAISFTFDDGSPSQYTIVPQLFNEFNMNMTLFIVTGESFGWPAQWSKLQEISAQGHEIASHTVTHTSFGDISDSLETIELAESREKIESYITDKKCITMAYPYCATGNRSIAEQYYAASRICSGQIESSTPRNFSAISSIVCGTQGSVKTADNFISRANSAIRNKGWVVLLLHGVDDDGGWSPVTSDVLRETLTFFAENKNEYWVDSFGNVTRYILERNAASITEIAADDSSITVQVADTLDNAAYNHPITIRRVLPQDWASASVKQNGESVNTTIVQVDDTFFVQFDAVPDAGEVIISRENATRVDNETVSEFGLQQNYPNPFNPKTTIQYSIPSQEHVSINLYNVNGKLVKTLVDETQRAGNYSFVFNGESLASGVYLYVMQAGLFTQTKRLLLMK